MTKTIKQIADELGVPKQKVYRFIRQNNISEVHNDSSVKQSVLWYDDAAQKLIKSYFNQNTLFHKHSTDFNTTVQSGIVDMLQNTIDTLQGQLKIKDFQISQLTAVVRKQTESISAIRKKRLVSTVFYVGENWLKKIIKMVK